MKAVHMNKLGAVMEMKTRALFSKNIIIMPLFAAGFTFLMKMLYGSLSENGLTDQIKALALSYGALMNITMTGIYCVSALLAEEKEKHTLRVLMTSSVNGLEFFLGSLMPAAVMVTAVNALLVPVTGLSMGAAEWAAYLGISFLSAVASAVIGMIFGIFAKNQVTAGSITTPALMVLMLVPMLANLNETVGKISDFLFTGIMNRTLENIAGRQEKLVDGVSVLVILAEIVIAVVCFLAVYRKNGYDSE